MTAEQKLDWLLRFSGPNCPPAWLLPDQRLWAALGLFSLKRERGISLFCEKLLVWGWGRAFRTQVLVLSGFSTCRLISLQRRLQRGREKWRGQGRALQWLPSAYLGPPLFIQFYCHESRRSLLTHGRVPALPEEIDTLLFASHSHQMLSLLSASHCRHNGRG